MHKAKVAVMGIVGGVILATFIALLIPFKVTHVLSDSMSPTLETGDRVLVSSNKKYGLGSVVAFRKVFSDKGLEQVLFLVKRIVAIEGDHVSADGTSWYLNDMDMGSCSVVFDYIVPSGSYFVVGDNAGDSYDSREWNYPFVENPDIIGVVVRKLWSWEEVK